MKPMTFGKKQKLLEIPCSWYLDDLPPQMFMKSQDNASGWTSPDVIFKLWKDEFDYLYEYEDEGVFPITIQPDVSGRPQGIMMHTKLIEYMRSKPGVSFMANWTLLEDGSLKIYLGSYSMILDTGSLGSGRCPFRITVKHGLL